MALSGLNKEPGPSGVKGDAGCDLILPLGAFSDRHQSVPTIPPGASNCGGLSSSAREVPLRGPRPFGKKLQAHTLQCT